MKDALILSACGVTILTIFGMGLSLSMNASAVSHSVSDKVQLTASPATPTATSEPTSKPQQKSVTKKTTAPSTTPFPKRETQRPIEPTNVEQKIVTSTLVPIVLNQPKETAPVSFSCFAGGKTYQVYSQDTCDYLKSHAQPQPTNNYQQYVDQFNSSVALPTPQPTSCTPVGDGFNCYPKQ